MDAQQPTFDETLITQEEWHWVQELIRDVQQESKRETERVEFIKMLSQWDLVVRQFRKIEQRRMLLNRPTELDVRAHATCLHALLAIGQLMVIRSKAFRKDELGQWGVTREQIEAYIEELEQSFREWHHGFAPEDLKGAADEIFGVKT